MTDAENADALRAAIRDAILWNYDDDGDALDFADAVLAVLDKSGILDRD
jgi:hypothetical protein